MPRLAVLLLLTFAVLALAACGGGTGGDSAGDFEGAERDVARAIEDLEAAGQEDDAKRICEALLARAVVDRLEQGGGDCIDAVGKALDQADTFALTVQSVRVTGDRARARVEAGVEEAKVQTVELVRENDAWRISSLPGAA